MKEIVIKIHDIPQNDHERWVLKNGTPLNSIIADIEAARDKDKNAGEYPYNRCIEIIRRAGE